MGSQNINIENCIIENIRMQYFKFGTGKKIFVIIPGLSVQSVMGSAEAVAEEYDIMKDEYVTYVFDRRENIEAPYTIHDMAEDTVKVMKSLGIERCNLFGASQGGMIAMDIAINHNEMVNKLILGSTSSHVTKEQAETVGRWIEIARTGDAVKLLLEFGKNLYPMAVYEQYKDYFIENGKKVTEAELKRFIVLAGSIKDFNVTERLSEIDCPVLITGAFEDAVLDSDSTMEMAEKLDHRPDFKLFMYNGYGHAAFDTAPDYRERLYKFLKGGDN